jgi:hypothetical protein
MIAHTQNMDLLTDTRTHTLAQVLPIGFQPHANPSALVGLHDADATHIKVEQSKARELEAFQEFANKLSTSQQVTCTSADKACSVSGCREVLRVSLADGQAHTQTKNQTDSSKTL